MKFYEKTFEESLMEQIDINKESVFVPILPKGWIMEIPIKEI